MYPARIQTQTRPLSAPNTERTPSERRGCGEKRNPTGESSFRSPSGSASLIRQTGHNVTIHQLIQTPPSEAREATKGTQRIQLLAPDSDGKGSPMIISGNGAQGADLFVWVAEVPPENAGEAREWCSTHVAHQDKLAESDRIAGGKRLCSGIEATWLRPGR
jgi:hypothetical protein